MRGFSRAFLRLFMVQASHNYDRMIGLGVGWATEPLLADLPDDARHGAEQRGTRLFNSHPYLAGLAVGAIARAEHDGVPGAQIDRLRSALSAPLGAVGDKLVWAGTLPATVAAGMIVAIVVSPLAGVITFLGLHNALHLVLRWWGLRAGTQLGMGIAGALNSRPIRWGLKVGGPAAAFAIGAALPIIAAWALTGFPRATYAGVVAIAVAGVVVGRWLMPSVGALRVGLVLVAAALIMGWVWPS
jgi:PTS system mannose-specific IID component